MARLVEVTWYSDREAAGRGEPGIEHSFVASLATAVNHAAGDLDPAWLMGASGFAFRSFLNTTFCPSAMSVFEWAAVLPEAVEQAGYRCTYVSRMWEEGAVEEARRQAAHAAIVAGIEGGAPAVVWDIGDHEWGLIVGFDDAEQTYSALTCQGRPASLPYARLGLNGIDILSVAVIGEPNGRRSEAIVRNSLRRAIVHAAGEEWTDRPEYQNGLAGYEMWADLFDKWALIVGAGRGRRLPPDLPDRARYFAAHHYSARCYARDYLRELAARDRALEQAAASYAEVAACLRPVWERSPAAPPSEPELLRSLAESIRAARVAEAEGIERIEEAIGPLDG